MAPKSLSLKNYLLNWWLLFFSLFSFGLVGGRLMSDSAIMKRKRGWKSVFTWLLWVNSSISSLNFSRMQATFWIIRKSLWRPVYSLPESHTHLLLPFVKHTVAESKQIFFCWLENRRTFCLIVSSWLCPVGGESIEDLPVPLR